MLVNEESFSVVGVFLSQVCAREPPDQKWGRSSLNWLEASSVDSTQFGSGKKRGRCN